MELPCDAFVVGGGCGGVAEALAATDLGHAVILSEVGSWVGGQLTSQAVPTSRSFWSRLVSSCTGLLTSKPRSGRAVFDCLGAYVLSVLVWCCPLMAARRNAGSMSPLIFILKGCWIMIWSIWMPQAPCRARRRSISP